MTSPYRISLPLLISVTLASFVGCAASEQDLGDGSQGITPAPSGSNRIGSSGSPVTPPAPPNPPTDAGTNDASSSIPTAWNQPPGSTRCAYGPEDISRKTFTDIRYAKSDYRAWCFPNDDVTVEWKLFSVSSTGKRLDLNDQSILSVANVYAIDYSNNDPGDFTGTRVPVKFTNACTVQTSAPTIAPLPAPPVDLYARCTWKLVTNIYRPGYHDLSLILRTGFPNANGVIDPAYEVASLYRIGWVP